LAPQPRTAAQLGESLADLAPGVTKYAHGRVVAAISKAVYEVKGEYLETDALVENHYGIAQGTGKGVRFKQVACLSSGPLHLEAEGRSSYFVRIKHVIRPKDDVAFSKVAASGGRQHIAQATLLRAVNGRTDGRHAARKADVVPVFSPLEHPANALEHANEKGTRNKIHVAPRLIQPVTRRNSGSRAENHGSV
jgi:hypothetical protein